MRHGRDLQGFRHVQPASFSVRYFGLRTTKNSRIMTRLSGANVPFNDMILGRLLDTVSYVLYTLQVLGGAKPQEPKSIVEAMIGKGNGKEASFMTREDFEKERRMIMKNGKEVKDGDRTWESICADHPIG